jgi:hypothetical protein
MHGCGKADQGCLHAAAVSRYDALKRGINGASETVVIDVSFFIDRCLAKLLGAGCSNGETPSGVETSAKNLNESESLCGSIIFFVHN